MGKQAQRTGEQARGLTPGQILDRYGLIGGIALGGAFVWQVSPEVLSGAVQAYGLPQVTAGAAIVLLVLVEGQVIWWLGRELRRVNEARIQEVRSALAERDQDRQEMTRALLEYAATMRALIDRIATPELTSREKP